MFDFFKTKIANRSLIKKLGKAGMSIEAPFTIIHQENISFDAPVYMGPGAWLELKGKLYIGKGTIIGPRLKVHTSNHNYEGCMLPYDETYIAKNVVISENVWIGSDVTILPGVHIGEGAVIAACACVTKDVPPLAIVGGCPSRILKMRDKERYYTLKDTGQIYLEMKNKGMTNTSDSARVVNVSKK